MNCQYHLVSTVGAGICEAGNFLGLVMMQARFDPFLQEIINSPRRQVRYLSAAIQNEIIKLIANATWNRLLRKIVDTTSDITCTDQLSVITRWINVNDMEIKETFMGLLKTTDGTTQRLCDLVIQYFQQLGLDIRNIRGQGYDGASVVSGKKGGIQKKIWDFLKLKGIEPPIPFVHCASQFKFGNK